MKYAITLGVVLMATWMLWSGHTEPFLVTLGVLSVILSVWVTWRMGILDRETVPLHLGIRPFTHYFPWLLKEIVVSNIVVAKIILSPTPGTVSIAVEGDQIQVHALSFEGSAEDLSGEMDRRVCELER